MLNVKIILKTAGNLVTWLKLWNQRKLKKKLPHRKTDMVSKINENMIQISRRLMVQMLRKPFTNIIQRYGFILVV